MGSKVSVAVIALLLLLPINTAWTLAAEGNGLLIPVDGSSVTGSLTSLDEKTATFDRQGKPDSRSLADIVRWGAPVARRDGTAFVQLKSGGQLVGDPTAISEGRLKLATRDGELALSMTDISRIVWQYSGSDAGFGASTPGSARSETSAPLSGYVLILANGDRVSGRLTDIAEDRLRWQTEASTLELPIDRVAAVEIISAKATVDPESAREKRVWIGLDDGSLVWVQKATVDEKQAMLHLSVESKVQTRRERIVFLQPTGGKARYLSDLAPASYKHLPFLSVARSYAADRSLSGGPLRVGGQPGVKGLAMPSASRMTFAIDRPARRLAGTLAIDDSVGRRGSVVYRVFADDGSGSWQPKFASNIVRGGDPPVSLSVDVAGAKRLALVVEYADFGDQCDHANWLDLRVVE